MTVGAFCDTRQALCGDAEFLPPPVLSSRGLVEELRQLRRQAARIEARTSQLIDEAARRGIPAQQGFGSATAWLIALTGDPPAVCRSRVQVARALREMPATQQAFARGELSETRVRLLAAACEFAPQVFARDEGLLVDQARSLPSRVFPQALAHWRRLADPDGALADAELAFERRRLHVSATWAGMVRVDGDLDPESGATVIAALGSLVDPQVLDREDERTPSQRRADALVEICRRHLDSAHRPQVGRERPHLTLTVALATLAGRGEPLADLDTGPIPLEAARRLACDAAVIRMITGPGAEALDTSRCTRVIPPSIRRSLNHRDRGCTYPGCGVPAHWCDAHHIVHWADGGETEPANLQLLCRRHHRLAHNHTPRPQRE